MTNQTHTRLSDEAMAKVIESQMGWLDATYSESGLFTYRCVFTEDPRDHTDAALELLHHLCCNFGDITTLGHKWYFRVFGANISDAHTPIPISGEPFRYAIVALAAKVLGVEGGE